MKYVLFSLTIFFLSVTTVVAKDAFAEELTSGSLSGKWLFT